MRPQARQRVRDLISGGLEEDRVRAAIGAVDVAGDDADPPAVVVEGIDGVEEGEAGRGRAGRRHGAEVAGADGLGEGLGGGVVLQEAVVADDVEVVGQSRDHRGGVVGAAKALLLQAHLHLVAPTERHCRREVLVVETCQTLEL